MAGQAHRHHRCLAVQAFGIEAIVTCGSDEKCAAARGVGRDPMRVNYRTQDFVEEVKRLTGGAGVNARARHGRRRLSAAQSRLPCRGRPPCLDRCAGRHESGDFHSPDHEPAPDAHRLDPAPALASLQGRACRRDPRDGLAAPSRRASSSRPWTMSIRWKKPQRRTGASESDAHFGKIVLKLR